LLAEFLQRFRRPIKTAGTAAFLGLALGYCTFYFLFPNVSVPAAGESSIAAVLGILAIAGILAGLVTEDLPSAVLQSFIAVPIGVTLVFVFAVSPVITGVLEVRADDLMAFIVRLGLPLYLLAVPMYCVSGLVGLLLRDRFAFRSESFLRPRRGREQN